MEHYFYKLIDQQDKTNELLERQTAAWSKHLEQQATLIQLLEQLVQLAGQHVEVLQNEMADLLNEPLMDKLQVMDYLKISDATYRRYVKDGKLNPMSLDKIDWYYKRDLARALRESRRKGRI